MDATFSDYSSLVNTPNFAVTGKVFDFSDRATSDNSVSELDVGKSYYQLGKLHYDKSDLKMAEQSFTMALKYFRKPRDIFSIFKTLGFLIRLSSEKLEDEKAQVYIKNSEELVDELPTVLGSLNAEYFYNFGIVKNYRGAFAEARKNFLYAYKKSKEGNEPELQAKCLLALATNYFKTREYDIALSYINQLNQLLTIVSKEYLAGSMYLLAGRIYFEQGNPDKALELLSKSNNVLLSKKCWNLYGYILLSNGLIYKNNGDFDRALWYYELALNSVDKNVFRRLVGLVEAEINDVKDTDVDLYLDRANRKVKERILGEIDFKHRFVLLEILFLLANNIGKFFDKEELVSHVWKDNYNPLIHDKLIYTSISRLRKLVEPKSEKEEKSKYIIRCKDGYTFNPQAKIRFHSESDVINNASIANVELSSMV